MNASATALATRPAATGAAPIERPAAIAAALRGALARDELSLEYQPQVDLRTGKVIGVEALLRWNHAELGFVAPNEFVPVAEALGIIVGIGEWVFRSACAQSVAWVAAGLPSLRIGINLSAHQLAEANLSQRLQTIVLETGADPRHLGIEIAESVLMRNLEQAGRTLHELSAIGIEIALDNFGTSYSNIGALRALPFDVLKIDRSVIHDVTAATEDVSITRAVLLLAQGLKLKVMAEGVETEGQLKLLIANGCEAMQGFVFSPSLPASGVEALLRAGRELPQSYFSRQVKRRTLLVVDDEENVLSSLRRLLRTSGYHLVFARSGPEGLARLAEHDVDVIVSDQRMPGMTGVEFLRRAKELYPDTVRIVLSGYTELQSITDAVNEGAIYKFLTKPWDDEHLRAHIAEAFRHKEMSDENLRLHSELRRANHELSQANARQQALLRTQDERLGLEQCRALNAQDLLEYLPTSMIGIDTDGTIAFVNRDARVLMGEDTPLVGRTAVDALPAEWLAACGTGAAKAHPGDASRAEAMPKRVALNGRHYLLSCADIDDPSQPRGRLLSIVPDFECLERTPA